jgi:chorismate mutase
MNRPMNARMNEEDARQKLEEYRVQIDDVDRRIVELLNERTAVVENIGRVKREAQLPIYEPRREEQVFANITGTNRGPLTEGAVRRIFERIIDEMRSIQRLRMASNTQQDGGDQ